jgi:hypothetical protein
MAIASQLQKAPPAGAQARVDLEQIADALAVFGTLTYGRPAESDSSALNKTLDSAVDVVRRLRFGSFWPIRTANAMARSVTGLWT